jgi:uncharacterized protein YraI
LGYDDGEDDLWNAIRSAMQRVPADKHFVVRVTIPTLNVREGPSTAYKVLNTAYAGDEFVAFDFDGYWYKIYYPASSFPYYAYIYGGDGVSVKYMDGDNFVPVVKVTASLLNVRSGPSTSYPILTQTAEGQCFAVESLSGDWAKIMLPDSNSRGWISYFAYTDFFSDVSLLNDCFFGIDSLVYEDTLNAGDTCTLSFFLENAGFVSADSLLKAKFVANSFFFDLESWEDSQRASTSGYKILPNQRGFRTIVLKAGVPSKDTLVTEKLILERGNDEASDTIEVEIFIRKTGTGKNEERIELNMPDMIEERYFIYDVSGRMVFSKNGSFDKREIPLENGVYFLFLASGRDVVKKKIFLVK